MPLRRATLARISLVAGICLAVGTCGIAAEWGSDVRALSLAGLGIESGLVLIAVAGALRGSAPPTAALGLLPGGLPRRRLPWLILGTVALSHALDCLLELSQLREHSALAAFDETLRGTRGAELALALLAMAGAPALGEELLCRGWIQRALVPRLGGAGAVTAAALVFGVLHVDPAHALFAVFLGLYLGVIALRAGSTWPSIFCHGVNNALAVLLAAELLPAPPRDASGAILGLAVAGGALVASRPPRRPREASNPPRAGGGLQPDARSDDP